MAEKKETFWSRLASGKFPSVDVNTNVGFDQQSLFAASTVIFVLIVLATVSYFAIKKRLT